MESLMKRPNTISNIHNIIPASMTTHNTPCNIPLTFQVQEWTSTPFLERSGTRNLRNAFRNVRNVRNTSRNISAESSSASGMQRHLWDRFQVSSGPFAPWNLFLLHRLDLRPALEHMSRSTSLCVSFQAHLRVKHGYHFVSRHIV